MKLFAALFMTAALLVTGTTVGRAADARACPYLTEQANYWRKAVNTALETADIELIDLTYMHVLVVLGLVKDACGTALYPELQGMARSHLKLRLSRADQ